MRSDVTAAAVVLVMTVVSTAIPVLARSGSALPPAQVEGDGHEPVRVVGTWTFSSSLVAQHYVEPVAALMNVTRYLARDHSDWVPIDEQILGHLDGTASSSPVHYRVSLPVRPEGAASRLCPFRQAA